MKDKGNDDVGVDGDDADDDDDKDRIIGDADEGEDADDFANDEEDGGDDVGDVHVATGSTIDEYEY